MAGLILWMNYIQRNTDDYGLWSQFINWPLAGILAGIGFDLLVTAFAPFVKSLRAVDPEAGQAL